ncbi:hypothetical protein K438DRAFT_1999528 [Mycena galopus ATCC 62051]|nr:hypothetical protein K438DRAFT_1999528 [Mycena galopus ATCC 62051]
MGPQKREKREKSGRYAANVIEGAYGAIGRDRALPTCSMSLSERTARFIDDIAQEGEDDAYDSSPQDHDDDEDSHEAMARRLDRRDFGNLEGVSLFDVLPPTPSSGDDSYDWPSRSPSPMHLDAPALQCSKHRLACPAPALKFCFSPAAHKTAAYQASVAATVLDSFEGRGRRHFSDLEDFIDDAEPTDDPQIVHKSTAQSLEQEAQELDEVAEYYRGGHALRRTEPQQWTKISMGASMPLRLGCLQRRPGARPTDLGQFTAKPQIFTMFAWPSRSTENSMVRTSSGLQRNYRNGICAPSYSPAGHQPQWEVEAPHRKVGTLLRNDLVFVRDWAFVGIPRVSYRTDDPNSPAPQFSEEYPELAKCLMRRSGGFMLEVGRVHLEWTASGLEEHSWESEDIFAKTWSGHGSMYQTADANPTNTELAHFAACDWRGLTGVVHPRQDGTCTLQAGDPVVVVAGRHAHGQQDVDLSVEKDLERSSALSKSKSATALHVSLQGRFKIRNIPKFEKTTDVLFNETTIVVPVACLRLHFSAIIRNVFIDDRVKVVSGNELWVSGRVEDIDGNIITVRPRESEALLHVELRHINHDFQVGDLVKVVRGIDEGTVGFIIGFKIFGHIELFPVSGRPKQQDLEDGGNPVVVPTTHIQFLGVQTLADLDAQTELAKRLNRMEVKRKEWKQDLMNTGRGYLGMEVQLVRKMAYTKQYGTVVGFTREKEGGIYKGVKVEVQLEIGHAKIWVGLRNVIERFWGINIGVENGTWLLNEKFFNKRIDMTIAGIAQSKFPSLINTRNSHHDGARGFLEPLKEKRTESTLRKKGFGLCLPPFSQITVQGRGLIIGPDVNASWQHLGDYAQTVPGETELPLVKVLFPPLYVELPNTKQTDGEGCELDTPLYKALGVVLAARTAAAADPNDKVKHLDYIRGAADFIVAHGFDLDDEMADDIAEITAYMKNIRHQTDGKGCERDPERTTRNRPFPVFKPASALPRTSRGRDTESDDERAEGRARVCTAKAAALADPTNIAKKLHYKREAADYAEIHGYDDTIEDAEHIKAYVYQKMRDDFRLDELRYRAVSCDPFREPGLIDEYVAAAKKFAKDLAIPTRRTTAWTTRSLLLWDDGVRARRLGRDMRIVEVRNPFPLHDARRAAFDLQMREHMALYKGVPLDTLAESVEWPSIILRLHNRFHADPSSMSVKGSSAFIKAMVDRAKMEATQ